MIVVLYVRGDQLDQLRESHFRKQQSLRGMSYSSKTNQDILSADVFLMSSWYQQKSKYEHENRGPDTEREEEFMFVERNQTKYSVLKDRTLSILRKKRQ
jgi:hypothetical protein